MDWTLYEIDADKSGRLVITNRTQEAPTAWFGRSLLGVPEYLIESRLVLDNRLSLPTVVEENLHVYINPTTGDMFAA